MKNFIGHPQTDGQSVYEHATIGGKDGIDLMHCKAHIQRYFEKALADDKVLAEYFLKEVQKLYTVERICREENYTPEQILDIRQHEAVPILSYLKQWMLDKYANIKNQTPFSRAINYALSRLDKLSVYTV